MNANIFIEQPVGVGFSYAERGQRVSTTEESAKDSKSRYLLRTLYPIQRTCISHGRGILRSLFLLFMNTETHLISSHFCQGRYLPVYAAEIYHQNMLLVKAGLTSINLQSVMIGNGLTDAFNQIYSGYEFGCQSHNGSQPFLTIEKCMKMCQLIPRCKTWIDRSCISHFDLLECKHIANYCLYELWQSYYYETGTNPYDVRRKCEGDIDETMCYPDVGQSIVAYLNSLSSRPRLGVDPHFTN